jgi:hypothetical protein
MRQRTSTTKAWASVSVCVSEISKREAAREEGAGLVVELDDRFAFRAVEDADARQGEFRPDAGAEGLAGGFLGGEAGGQRRIGVGFRQTEFLLRGREDLVEERGAMLPVRRADAVDLREVHADAEHVAAFEIHAGLAR